MQSISIAQYAENAYVAYEDKSHKKLHEAIPKKYIRVSGDTVFYVTKYYYDPYSFMSSTLDRTKQAYSTAMYIVKNDSIFFLSPKPEYTMEASETRLRRDLGAETLEYDKAMNEWVRKFLEPHAERLRKQKQKSD